MERTLFQVSTPINPEIPSWHERFPVFVSAQEAWLASLTELRREGELTDGVEDKYSVGSAFGEKNRTTRELSALQFTIRSARQRLIYSTRRPVDLGYAIANLIWVLSGSDDVETISFYNPRGKSFSDDGLKLFAAPGTRIFASPDGDQFEKVVSRLRQDPTTRRAVIQIFSPADLFTNTRDCSCVVSLQFLLRRNILSCITYMRSQSALMVMPYDIFLLSMIHEAVAVSVNAEVGTYHHFCGSLHFYEDEQELVDTVLEESPPSPSAMPPMRKMSREIRDVLATAEAEIRLKLVEDPYSKININQYGLDSYWTELLRVMVVAVRRRHDTEPFEEELSQIPSLYTDILTAR